MIKSNNEKIFYLCKLLCCWWKIMNIAKYQNMFDEKSKKGPYIYDIHEKRPIFASPSHLFLSVRMGLNWARPPHPWMLKLRLPTTPPHPHPLRYSCCISIIFSWCFHHIQCSCNSQLAISKKVVPPLPSSFKKLITF